MVVKTWPMKATLVALIALPIFFWLHRRRAKGAEQTPEQDHNTETAARRNPNAADWLVTAAEQGHMNAQYTLALMFGKGDRVPQDFRESEKWARRAAANGHTGAQNILKILAQV